MKEHFVTYEIALKLKELGFDEECIGVYMTDYYPGKNRIFYDDGIVNGLIGVKDSTYTLAPLWQQVFDWFEKEHNLKGYIKWGSEYLQIAYYQDSSGMEHYISWYGTIEEAKIGCVEKLIELIK